MERIRDAYDDQVADAVEALTDDRSRELLLAVDRQGKLRQDHLEQYAEDTDTVEEAFHDLEQAGLAIHQREITDTGAQDSYEVTFQGETFLDAVKYRIEDVESAEERYNGDLDDKTVEQLELVTDPVNRLVLEYLERSDDSVEFRELRLYSEQQGLEEPYGELRSSMTEMEENDLVWTQDEFDPQRGNTIRCGLYPDGEDLIQGLEAYRSDGAVQRPDTGAGRV